ncbi:hypothetical protein AWB68_06364 [Caballeronia choica]|uniref:Novel STAND NTPase 1 domain-containing protein n=1 Tax=Caballeronia choica TaxID=326476 RepID=A0A158KLP4_9BURK|nr:ATP-binding protein [Caballeronia choica]SAL82047.1 hypothetical protein AWB68_06364 [Caballeronia choica]
MDLKRLTEWLKTGEGIVQTIVAFVGVPASIWAVLTKTLHPVAADLHLRPWMETGIAGIFVIGLLLIIWRGFRRFAKASRLEQPDAFILRPTGPETLIGRTEDLKKLIAAVNQNRLVLLDGESGCGKSALINAGLVPTLNQKLGLLPVEIRDWGDDWVRGPLAALLDALFQALLPSDRESMNWKAASDLAADAPHLAAELNTRLKSVLSVLGRRPLLIADQFDDYQARHREHFLDENGNWLSPSALAKKNRFWELVSIGLRESRIHVLVVARADTASGLTCIRFLDESAVARTLARVDSEYLRPLLQNIAPDTVTPSTVSNSEGGWQDLRERLELDLKAEGAVLMQQVRTVLLGLRQLPLLTPRHYRVAGGLRGVEALFISRAISRAGDTAGGGAAGREVARAMLAALILPGGPNQPPKAKRASFTELVEIAENETRAKSVLDSLQRGEVVRPAETVSSGSAWQLDHDYLARAVLAEARQTDRWSVALREGRAQYDHAAGDWKRKWAALLPMGTLARISWERARGRLKFGDAASYARASALKPSILVVCLALVGAEIHAWNSERLITAEANRIVDRFGGSGERDAVLTVWGAPDRLRQRVYQLITEDNGKFERAARSRWPLAQVGLEPDRAREVAADLLAALQNSNEYWADLLLRNYYDVSMRIDDARGIDTAAGALRTILEKRLSTPDKFNDTVTDVASYYAKMVLRSKNSTELYKAAIDMRVRIVDDGPRISDEFFESYIAILARIKDPAWKISELAALRAAVLREPRSDNMDFGAPIVAYAAVAAQINDASSLKAAAAFLRTNAERASYTAPYIDFLRRSYSYIASRLPESDRKSEAEALLAELRTSPEIKRHEVLTTLYATLASQLSDTENLAGTASNLRIFASPWLSIPSERFCARAYVDVMTRLSGQAGLRKALDYLLEEMGRLPLVDRGWGEVIFAEAAVLLRDPVEMKEALPMLRTRLQNLSRYDEVDEVLGAYSLVIASLPNAADLNAEAAALKALLWARDENFWLARPYADVVVRLNDQKEMGATASDLHLQIMRAKSSQSANSLANAFGIIAQAMIARYGAQHQKSASLALQALILAGHPFLTEPAPLLAVLKPVAGIDFGDDVEAAERWATAKYGIPPEQFRPDLQDVKTVNRISRSATNELRLVGLATN